MHIIACDVAEQVVALYNTRQRIRPDTNAVVGAIAHRTVLNGYIYTTQRLGNVENTIVGTGARFAAVRNLTIRKLGESFIYFYASPVTGGGIGTFEKNRFCGCSISEEFGRSGSISK